MSTNVSPVSKFRNAVKERMSVRVANYNFRSNEKKFYNFENDQSSDMLKEFTILTVLDRFFYSDLAGQMHISNVIVDRNEKVSFYLDKKKSEVLGQKEFTFAELNDLSFSNRQFNRKIIIVGIYEGKLTKVEAQATSEKPVMNYLESSGNETTVNIDSEERQYKEFVSSILRLTKSPNQTKVSTQEENAFFEKLESHVNAINHFEDTEEDEPIQTTLNLLPEDDFNPGVS